MIALVTGGCGFIGYNLCRSLRGRQGWITHVIDNLSSGYKENSVLGGRYIYQDMHKYIEFLIKEIKPDVVFHFAAVPRVSYSVEHPYETAHHNVMATVKLLDAVRKHHPACRVIISSSSSVYGGAEVLPTPESHPCDPKSPYALDKYQCEQWASMFHSLYGLDVVSLRYFNVIGPYSRYGGAYSTVLSAWLYSLCVNPDEKPYLEGDGTQTRDFCFVDNVVQANTLAATRQTPFKADVFNVAQGQSHSLLDVKDMIEKMSGKTIELEVRPRRIGDVDHTLADISAAKEHLGYNPSLDFEKHVRVMYEWYRDDYTPV